MNLYGSYRKLFSNSIAAMSAAIEIYNKPKIEYRDECFVILLINAWELLLKAILSKNKQSIYYPKRRNQPYRTLAISDVLARSHAYFPAEVNYPATSKNLDCLISYRDQAIHFYNEAGFGVLIYALAQTAIVNYRDLVQKVFNKDLSEEISLSLLPIALSTPVDPVAFLNLQSGKSTTSKIVQGFTNQVRNLISELENSEQDTGRFLTVFKVNLVSTKKITTSDLIVGVQSAGGSEPLLVHKSIDPNVNHPHRQKDIVGNSIAHPGMKLIVGGQPLTAYKFQAILFHCKMKQDLKYCWVDESGAVTRYSQMTIEKLKRLSREEVDTAVNHYKQIQREKRNKKVA